LGPMKNIISTFDAYTWLGFFATVVILMVVMTVFARVEYELGSLRVILLMSFDSIIFFIEL